VRALAADVILIAHFAIALFIVLGLVAIWLGATLRWEWVRNRWLRSAHLAAILIVASEALAGVACPLTVWEDALRGVSGEPGFIARWVRRILYYDLPPWVFACAYVAFACAVAVTWRLVPPRRTPRAGPGIDLH